MRITWSGLSPILAAACVAIVGAIISLCQRSGVRCAGTPAPPREARLQVWAGPFTKLRLQKNHNLFQDPFERADITSNTVWDRNLNQIGGVHGVMDEVSPLVATFRDFPPRSFPPRFVPATIMEETLEDMKEVRRRKSALNAPFDRIPDP